MKRKTDLGNVIGQRKKSPRKSWISSHFFKVRANKFAMWKMGFKSSNRPNAIWQRDANFQFSITFNFNIFQCFSNIRNHLSNFCCLVCISCKIFTRLLFYLFLKTENSRRVAESRPVCVGLKANFHCCVFHTYVYARKTLNPFKCYLIYVNK